jgi:hypothetical protein
MLESIKAHHIRYRTLNAAATLVVGRESSSWTYLAVTVWSKEQERSAGVVSEGCTCSIMEMKALMLMKEIDELSVEPHSTKRAGRAIYTRVVYDNAEV